METVSRRSAVAIIFAALVQFAVGQSVTKCGDYGDASLYNSTTLPYVFYNNPWGNDGSGFSCITVKDNGTAFDATWRWNDHPDQVHAYPHLKFESPLYPLALSEMASLNFSASWELNARAAVNGSAVQQAQALDAADVQYDVALDMFLDTTRAAALSDLPRYEVMIWLSYSYRVYPVGIDTAQPEKNQYVIDGTRFFLYNGTNTQNQTVLSWLPEHNLTSVPADTDYSPLVHYLWQFDFMPADLFLGTVQYGTETYHALDEVLFSAQNYSLGLAREQGLQVAELKEPKTVSVPSQVPTVKRFESAGARVVVASAVLACAVACAALLLV